jgi:hypothetical protein
MMAAGSIRSARAALVGIITSTLLACSGGDGGNQPDPVFQITVAPVDGGDNQTWTTGHRLPDPIRVLVTRDGEPAGAVGVVWTTAPGQGIVSPPTSITGSDGIATTRWNLGTQAKQYFAVAKLADAPAGDSVVFTATAVPNFPDSIHLYSGDNQSAPVNTSLAEPLVVMVGDEFNNPFSGASIEWLVVSGQATLSQQITTSCDGGLAQVNVQLGATPGPIQIKAQFAGATSGPNIIFNITATP